MYFHHFPQKRKKEIDKTTSHPVAASVYKQLSKLPTRPSNLKKATSQLWITQVKVVIIENKKNKKILSHIYFLKISLLVSSHCIFLNRNTKENRNKQKYTFVSCLLFAKSFQERIQWGGGWGVEGLVKPFCTNSSEILDDTFWILYLPRPRGYGILFMLNSSEHDICPNKSQFINNCKFFRAKHSLAWNILC